MDPSRLFHEEDNVSRVPPGRRVLAVVLLVVGFALSIWGSARILRAADLEPPFVEVLDDKLAHLREHADEYDVVYYGTSTMYRNVDPAVVDSTLGARGVECRSLNLAVSGMTVNEGEVVLRALERAAPANLRVVVIEPLFRPMKLKNWATERAMTTHDADLTATAVDYVLETNGGGLRRRWDALLEAQAHVLAYLGSYANLGRFARWLLPDPAHWRGRDFDAPDFTRGGFLSLEHESDEQFAVRHAGFRARREEMARRMEESDPESWAAAPLGPGHRERLRDVVERVRALGAQPIFQVGPAFLREEELAELLASADRDFADVPRLNYLKGQGLPEIYDIDLWFDSSHLTVEGAAVLSRRLGEDLLPYLAPAGGE